MANPNVVNVTDIKGDIKGQAITTSVVDLLENAAASGKLLLVEHLSIANIDGVNAADVTIGFFDASATTTFKIAHLVTVPAKGTLLVTDKKLWLTEGDKITIQASANGDLEAVISWTIIDD